MFVSVPEGSENDIDEETQSLLTSDFEIGHYIRERIVPRAVLYYTGKFTSMRIRPLSSFFTRCDFRRGTG